ncbi:MAG: succinate dehydrogenase cytochrome b subunit [Planctomycetaceae bacterium]
MSRIVESVGSFWLTRALTSSIGRKALMAITGLGLCGFLVIHLAGNLLLYVGADAYDKYAHSLHAQWALLVIAEISLLLLFLVHIWLAFTTNRDNKAARPVGYEVKQTKQAQEPLEAPASSIMFGTGLVVLLFLLLHLSDFRFELREHPHVGDSPFAKAVAILRNPVSATVYVVGSLVLGYHVLHGFQSAFQTLGANHPKYAPLIRRLSLLFAIAVAVGFASFPIWAWAVRP